MPRSLPQSPSGVSAMALAVSSTPISTEGRPVNPLWDALTALSDFEPVGGVPTRRSREVIQPTLKLPSCGTRDEALLPKRNLREAANTGILEGDRLGLTQIEYWVQDFPIGFLPADPPPVRRRNTDAP